jgi:hypothetical protein
VDQPGHALYEATFYLFKADTTIEIQRSVGAPTATFEVGTIQHTVTRTACTFGGGSWSAVDAQTLVINAPCDDGKSRNIELRFRGSPLLGKPESMLVDGKGGWAHPGFDWAFTRCGGAPCSVP